MSNRIRVHWNRTQKLFSVLRGGLVAARLKRVVLRDVTVVFRPGGFARWQATGRRTVFSLLEGLPGMIPKAWVPPPGCRVRFDRTAGRFEWEDGATFVTAAWAILTVADNLPVVVAGPKP